MIGLHAELRAMRVTGQSQMDRRGMKTYLFFPVGGVMRETYLEDVAIQPFEGLVDIAQLDKPSSPVVQPRSAMRCPFFFLL